MRHEYIAETAGTQLMIGECLRREGRGDEAVPNLRKALEACAESELSMLYEVVQELAVVAMLHGHHEVAVRLLGASDAFRRQAGLAQWDPRDVERTVDSLRRTLRADAFETLWQRGAELTREDAIELARTVE
jgi:hypothetical protein